VNCGYATTWLALLGGLAATRVHTASGAINSSAACRIAHTPESHVGETITFVGYYMTDHIERSLIRPEQCNRGIGVGEITAAAQKYIDASDRPPFQPGDRIRAAFTATIVRDEHNEVQLFHDTGVRLNVIQIVPITADGPEWGVRAGSSEKRARSELKVLSHKFVVARALPADSRPNPPNINVRLLVGRRLSSIRKALGPADTRDQDLPPLKCGAGLCLSYTYGPKSDSEPAPIQESDCTEAIRVASGGPFLLVLGVATDRVISAHWLGQR
jgi:hypothetical protein